MAKKEKVNFTVRINKDVIDFIRAQHWVLQRETADIVRGAITDWAHAYGYTEAPDSEGDPESDAA